MFTPSYYAYVKKKRGGRGIKHTIFAWQHFRDILNYFMLLITGINV
jgi:hypothetical protein